MCINSKYLVGDGRAGTENGEAVKKIIIIKERNKEGKKEIHGETSVVEGRGVGWGNEVRVNRPKRRLNFYRPTFFSLSSGREGL